MNRRTVPLLFSIALLASCSDHFSTQEAYETCQEIADRTLTSTEESFADCVDCHERCGIDCDQQNAEPPDEYICPDDVDK